MKKNGVIIGRPITAIIIFIELNVDGCGTNAEVLIEATGPSIDRNAIEQQIQRLKAESEYPDTDSLVAETCDWLKTQGISCRQLDYYEIEF